MSAQSQGEPNSRWGSWTCAVTVWAGCLHCLHHFWEILAFDSLLLTSVTNVMSVHCLHHRKCLYPHCNDVNMHLILFAQLIHLSLYYTTALSEWCKPGEVHKKAASSWNYQGLNFLKLSQNTKILSQKMLPFGGENPVLSISFYKYLSVFHFFCFLFNFLFFAEPFTITANYKPFFCNFLLLSLSFNSS